MGRRSTIAECPKAFTLNGLEGKKEARLKHSVLTATNKRMQNVGEEERNGKRGSERGLKRVLALKNVREVSERRKDADEICKHVDLRTRNLQVTRAAVPLTYRSLPFIPSPSFREYPKVKKCQAQHH